MADHEFTPQPEARDESSDKDPVNDFVNETEREDETLPRPTHPKLVTTPCPRYTVPPTVLHDGMLFRKVG
jgi:hypothetical protein